MFGMNLLIKPIYQLFLPVVILFFGWKAWRTKNWWRWSKQAMLFTVVVAVFVTPWLWRNYRLFNQFAFSSQGSFALVYEYLVPSVISIRDQITFDEAETISDARLQSVYGISTSQQADLASMPALRAESLRVLRGSPLIVARVLVLNSFGFWTSSNYAYLLHRYGAIAAPDPSMQPPSHLIIQGRWGEFASSFGSFLVQPFWFTVLIGRLFWIAIFLLFLVGYGACLVDRRNRTADYTLVLLACVYYTCVVWVNGFGIEARLRLPFFPLMFLFSSHALLEGSMRYAIRDLVIFLTIPFIWMARLLRPRPEAVILFYHSISASDDPFAIDPKMFERQLNILKKVGRIVPLSEVVAYASGKQSLSGSVIALTFDDGYVDFLQTALPVLKREQIPATLFVSERPDRNELGNDHALLTREQLVELSREPLVTLGAHGVSHRKLTDVSDESLRAELIGSKAFIEELTGAPCYWFAYPKGASNPIVREETRNAGFSAGFTIKQGTVRPHADLMSLRRVVVQKGISPFAFRWRLTRFIDWMSYFRKRLLRYGA
jgi:peptidoglycan/xylan/chitin deacetylase (PgdA/CDA1 family)